MDTRESLRLLRWIESVRAELHLPPKRVSAAASTTQEDRVIVLRAQLLGAERRLSEHWKQQVRASSRVN